MQFNEEVEVQEMERGEPEGPVTINEETIDRCLGMLQGADPTGELRPDDPEMALLEGTGGVIASVVQVILLSCCCSAEECRRMTPLIDQELEEIDRCALTFIFPPPHLTVLSPQFVVFLCCKIKFNLEANLQSHFYILMHLYRKSVYSVQCSHSK